MSTETHPAVSEAMREAVARDLDYLYGNQQGDRAYLSDATYLCRPAGPIASEIARLTGERDAAVQLAEAAERNLIARIRTDAAETARLRAALEEIADALGWAGTALRELDAYAAAGVTRSAANNASAALTSQEQADV